MSTGNLSLFEEPKRNTLAAPLARLAERGVYLGTSSWKYEGWCGQIYTRERYLTRGRFSQKRFASECLNEYAETFTAVCGDFSFYQFPTEAYWEELFRSAPQNLKFAFKIPEMITVKQWPGHVRYGTRGGEINETYLNADMFSELFLRCLEPYRQQVGVLLFEFGTMPRRHYESAELFVSDLDRFLQQLPGGFRFGVEIRNKEFFVKEHFDVLRRYGVAHVFNAWTRVPELNIQTAQEFAYTSDFLVARALLKHGRSYEQAVAQFAPYRELQEVHEPSREGLRTLIQRALTQKQTAFLFVNNRLEGNAPATIQAVVESADLS